MLQLLTHPDMCLTLLPLCPLKVIALCENYSDSNANVTTVPTWLLKRTRAVLRSLGWAKDAADRLVSSLVRTLARFTACRTRVLHAAQQLTSSC
jgi:hypothetical protein